MGVRGISAPGHIEVSFNTFFFFLGPSLLASTAWGGYHEFKESSIVVHREIRDEYSQYGFISTRGESCMLNRHVIMYTMRPNC